MDTEYEKQIKQGRDRLEVIASAAFTVNSAVQVIATTLIQEHAPREVEAGAVDIVEAGAHARSTCRTLADLAEQAKEGAKALGAISKEVEKIEYAARRLFADLLARADAEEQRRREEEDERRRAEEQRQQDLFAEKPAEEGTAPAADPTERRAQLLEVDEPGIVEPSTAAALPVYLDKAREQARQDAARGLRCETAGDLSTALDLPEAMGEHLPLIWAAYEETAQAAAPKGKKRKGGAA